MKLRTCAEKTGFPIIIQGSTIQVRPLSSSAFRRLKEKHTSVQRGVEKTNGLELTMDLFDQAVIGWDETIQDENGGPLDCTPANKRLICEHNMDFVNDVLAAIDDAEKARRAGEEGN